MRKFQAFERTRLFDAEWQVVQLWTTLAVPWTLDYHDTHFVFSLKKAGPVVIVLSQLDDRYFRGLEGQYHFELAFRLHKAGREDYLVRSQTPYRMRRSVNIELDLEAGEYQVLVKIHAIRSEAFSPVEQVIRKSIKERRDKLVRVGLAYDLAHGKGKFVETPDEKEARETQQSKETNEKRQAARDEIVRDREKAHYLRLKNLERERKKSLKQKIKRHQKTVKNQATSESNEGDVSISPKAPKKTHFADEARVESNGDYESHSEPDVESIASLSDLSDREMDLHIDSYMNDPKSEGKGVAKDSSVQHQEEPDEFEKDPWNAFVVVGLRVYHKVSDESEGEDVVKLKVVRPRLLADSSEEVSGNDEEVMAKGLDVDDSAKDATLEGGVKERKKSILGDSKKPTRGEDETKIPENLERKDDFP